IIIDLKNLLSEENISDSTIYDSSDEDVQEIIPDNDSFEIFEDF
ncbi:19727_t:CDS:1, partial [Dentiscutata erythropus]